MDDEGLVLQHGKLVLESFLQLDAVVELLDGCEFQARVHDLLYVVDLHQVAGRRQLDGIHLLLSESVLDLVRCYQGLLLLRCESGALVDEKTELPNALRLLSRSKGSYLLLAVVVSDAVDVDAETHELCQRLLTHQSLSLEVALLHALGREDLGTA